MECTGGIGTITAEMARQGVAELAIIKERLRREASPSDVKEARRELTGEPDRDAKQALLESVPESDRWDPVPGSPGHKARVAPSDDELPGLVETLKLGGLAGRPVARVDSSAIDLQARGLSNHGLSRALPYLQCTRGRVALRLVW